MEKKDILEKAQKENNGADEMYNYFYRIGGLHAFLAIKVKSKRYIITYIFMGILLLFWIVRVIVLFLIFTA